MKKQLKRVQNILDVHGIAQCGIWHGYYYELLRYGKLDTFSMSEFYNVAEPARKRKGLNFLIDTISIEKRAYITCTSLVGRH